MFQFCRAFLSCPDGTNKLAEAVGSVVTEPFLISQRQDTVVIGGEAFVGTFGRQFGKSLVADVGVDKSFAVEGVAAHYAAN
ncbi:hypothetical protein D3C86_2168340 [compost metagenome]